jgi:RimJ/RimL family protein N-acetyltransferase
MTDLDLLDLEGRTLYVLTPEGRIIRENDPDRSAGPQFWLAGCVGGTVARLHRTLAPDTAAEIAALVAREPPFDEPGALPCFIADYERLLPGAALSRELVHELPHGLRAESAAKLITSGSEEGARFMAAIAKDGMPRNLVELRMREARDLWAPWVILMAEGEVASMAFAARLVRDGAELGLATVPKFRGRGLARLVTAAWSNLPELKTRRLFYGADHDNLASQRVIAQLGLRRIGVSIRLT